MDIMTFRVSFPNRPEIWRRLQLDAAQTLADLHTAILQSFSWESEHLYAFFLSGKPWDPLSEYGLPEEAYLQPLDELQIDDDDASIDLRVEGDSDPLAAFGGFSDDELEDLIAEAAASMSITVSEVRALLEAPVEETAENRDVRQARLGDLGLSPGDTFLHIYDFDREWRFYVQLEARSASGSAQNLPRVLERVGEAPSQYAIWDDDDPLDSAFLPQSGLPVAS